MCPDMLDIIMGQDYGCPGKTISEYEKMSNNQLNELGTLYGLNLKDKGNGEKIRCLVELDAKKDVSNLTNVMDNCLYHHVQNELIKEFSTSKWVRMLRDYVFPKGQMFITLHFITKFSKDKWIMSQRKDVKYWTFVMYKFINDPSVYFRWSDKPEKIHMHLIGQGGYWLDKNNPTMYGENNLVDVVKCEMSQDDIHYIMYDWEEKKYSPYNGEWDQ